MFFRTDAQFITGKMGALNYIAYVIFAVLFVSVGFAMYAEYQRGAAEQGFRLKAKELAGRIQVLGDQSENTIWYFDITVPSNCELRFGDNAVIITIGEWSENFQVGVPVSGPTFSSQDLNLKMVRTENWVDVIAL